MDSARRISAVSSLSGLPKQTMSEICTLIRLIYADNQQIYLNSYASCRRLLDHIKQLAGIHHDETIDIIDTEGKLKELDLHPDDYANQYLSARNTYYVLKIERDSSTGEKRYTAHFNLEQVDQKLTTIFNNSLNALNKSVSKTKRGVTTGRQNSIVQSTSSSAQSKVKRGSSRK